MPDRTTTLIGSDHCLTTDSTLADPDARRKSTARDRVGELYRPGRFYWPAGSNCSLDRRGFTLTVFEPEVTDDLCDLIRDRPIHLGLVVESPLLMLCSRFGAESPWMATPYAWPLDAARSRRGSTPLDLIPQAGWARMHFNLVDAEDGIVRAQRSVALTPRFARTLRAAVRRQSLIPFDGDDYIDAVVKISFDFPSPASLARRAIARTVSSD